MTEKQLKQIQPPLFGQYPITQAYGEKYTSNFHTGIDYGAPAGVEIHAAHDGTVIYSGFQANGYGWHVILQREDRYRPVSAKICFISQAIKLSVFYIGVIQMQTFG